MLNASNFSVDTPFNNVLRALVVATIFACAPFSALASSASTLGQGSDNIQISQQEGNAIVEQRHNEIVSGTDSTESISHLIVEIEKLKAENEKLNSSLLALEKHTEAELERTVHFLLLLNMALYLSIVVAIVIRRFM